MINRIDLVVAAIVLAICAGLYYVTASFEEVSPLFAQDVPPEMFPRMLIWVIAAMALALPFERWLRGEKGKALDKARKSATKPIVYVTATFLVLVVLSIDWIGTFLALVLICIGLPMLWGERRWRIVVPFVAIFPLAVMVLFSQVLGVYFEPGVFGLNFQ